MGEKRSVSDRLGVSWLDVKLGLRMLRRRPVMAAAALFALMVGIPASMVPGHVARILEAPLPEDAADRVRSIRYWDQSILRPVSPTYFEFDRWSDELTAFETLGAFRDGKLNLRTEQGEAVLAHGAELSASVFGLLGAVPQQGRILDLGDERPGATDVAVISDDFWRNRLASDPDIVGIDTRGGRCAAYRRRESCRRDLSLSRRSRTSGCRCARSCSSSRDRADPCRSWGAWQTTYPQRRLRRRSPRQPLGSQARPLAPTSV